MKSNSTLYAPHGRGSQNQNSIRTGNTVHNSPLVNWAAIGARLWSFVKRLTSEVWFLVSRSSGAGKQATPVMAPPQERFLPSTFRRLSVPVFKIAVVLVLFVYIVQRDIQFTISMKSPLGGHTTALSTATGKQSTEMGIFQGVSLGSQTSASVSTSFNQQEVEQYLERFGELAQTEMVRYGVPASIKMAQAIHASHAGRSTAAKVDNNHFGTQMDGGQPYESAWRNWREHSLLLVNRFEDLKRYGNDYRAWARGLEKMNYNSEVGYANQLLEIIDRFHLEQLDNPTI